MSAPSITRPTAPLRPVVPVVRGYTPRSPLGKLITRYLRHPDPLLAAEILDRLAGTLVVHSTLHGLVIRGDGRREDLGLLGEKVVTTAGVNYIAGYLTGTNTGGNFKFHGLGTGGTGAVIGDTALGTELTTAYNPDSTRATGTSALGASNNIYHSVGTNTVDGAAAVTEFGLFTASSAGTLLDRFTFSVVNLASGDGLQTTFDLTFTAGG